MAWFEREHMTFQSYRKIVEGIDKWKNDFDFTYDCSLYSLRKRMDALRGEEEAYYGCPALKESLFIDIDLKMYKCAFNSDERYYWGHFEDAFSDASQSHIFENKEPQGFLPHCVMD